MSLFEPRRQRSTILGMSYQFPSDIQTRLDAFMQGGAFQSEDDVIRTAIAALVQIESEKRKRWNERNQMAEADFAQGRMEPLDREQFWQQMRE